MGRIFGALGRLFGSSIKECKSPRDYNLESFKRGEVYSVNLEPHLSSFLKPGWEGKVSLQNYKIYLSHGRGRDAKFKGIYHDTQYSFILAYGGIKNKGVACIGFDIQGDNSILIMQIQGVPEKKVSHVRERLQPFRWEKLLLRIMTDWAQENGYKKVKVIKAEQSVWFQSSCPNEQRKASMRMKYDVTAQRCGFKFDPEEKVYVLSLEVASR